MTKIVFDVRPIKMNEQIDQKILSDKAWMEEAKNINIFVVPNVPSEKLEKYISLAKDFLQKNNVEIKDSYVDKFSSSGVLSVKINFPTTSKLLQSSSFVFRVHETPKLEAQEVREGEASHVISESKSAIRGSVTIGDPASHVASLPEVCVIDTGVNQIAPLQGLISHASKEPNMPDDFDHNDHGTSVAYLVAYGEGGSPEHSSFRTR